MKTLRYYPNMSLNSKHVSSIYHQKLINKYKKEKKLNVLATHFYQFSFTFLDGSPAAVSA